MDLPPPRYLLAVDVETSGKSMRTNFLVQVGLALVEVQSGALLARFTSYVAQPDGTTWEQRCLEQHWYKYPDLYEKAKIGLLNADSDAVVAARLLDWVRAAVIDPANTRLVTDTPGFDLGWLNWLLGTQSRSYSYLFEDSNGGLLYRDALDVGSWFLGLGGECDPEASSQAAALKALDVKSEPKFEFQHTHDAADDAANIAVRAAWVMRSMAARE